MTFQRHLHFVTALLPIFRIYQLFGFTPFSIPPNERTFLSGSEAETKTTNHKWSIYGKVLFVLLFALAISSMFSDSTYVVDRASRMLNYMSFLMVISVRLLAAVVVIESIAARSEQSLFLTNLDGIDRLLRQKFGQTVDQLKTRNTTIFWIIFWVIKVIALQIFVVLTSQVLDKKGVHKYLWLLYVFPMAFSSIRYYQLIHYVEMIELRLKALNQRLIDICVTQKRVNTNSAISIQLSQFGSRPDRKLIDDIVLLRIIYNRLWEACGSMNTSFRWTLLLSVGSSFVIIVVNFYRSLVFLLTSSSMNTIDDIIMFFVWSVFHTLYLMKISKACADTINQVSKFPFQNVASMENTCNR